MAYKITDKCKRCGACKEACPMQCIDEAEPTYVIRQEECISCGTCQMVCPYGAPEISNS